MKSRDVGNPDLGKVIDEIFSSKKVRVERFWNEFVGHLVFLSPSKSDYSSQSFFYMIVHFEV